MLKQKKTYNKMSLFDKCRAYLLKNNIELKDDDYSIDGRLQVDSNNNILKWDFPLLQPSIEELDSKVDDKLLERTEKRYRKKDKLKQVKNFQFPTLDSEDLLNITELNDMLFINEDSGELFLYYKKQLRKVRLE